MSKKSTAIVTRTFQYGNENESSWPPRFPTIKRGFAGYWDPEKKKFVEGRPPRPKTFGKAPNIIPDTLPGTFYHNGVCRETNSRSEINKWDKESGCITTGSKQPPDPSEYNRRIAERRKDGKESLLKAVAAIDSGNAPLTEKQRHECDIRNEVVSNALNFDAYNVVGRKDNAKGKRFKRFRK